MSKRKVRGVGINDADYMVYFKSDGKQAVCRYYQTWRDMLTRCYSLRFKKEYPTYKDTTCCPKWLHFMSFRRWMVRQQWEGMQLDKDILGDDYYSPQTCCFVPGWLNSLFLDAGSARGKWPLGVHFNKRNQTFVAQLKIDNKGTHLGHFSTPEEAHEVYKEAKVKYVLGKMGGYPDQRIKQAVLKKLKETYVS